MPRHIWLYIVYGSPLVIFFTILVVMNIVLELDFLPSFGVAAFFSLTEFGMLKLVSSRLSLPH